MAATSVPDLPDDGGRREERVNEIVGEWLTRRFHADADYRFDPTDAVDATGIPEEDVRRCLDRLVEDDVTPLKREFGEYFLDE